MAVLVMMSHCCVWRAGANHEPTHCELRQTEYMPTLTQTGVSKTEVSKQDDWVYHCNDLIMILSYSFIKCYHGGTGQRVHDSSVLFLMAAYKSKTISESFNQTSLKLL